MNNPKRLLNWGIPLKKAQMRWRFEECFPNKPRFLHQGLTLFATTLLYWMVLAILFSEIFLQCRADRGPLKQSHLCCPIKVLSGWKIICHSHFFGAIFAVEVVKVKHCFTPMKNTFGVAIKLGIENRITMLRFEVFFIPRVLIFPNLADPPCQGACFLPRFDLATLPKWTPFEPMFLGTVVMDDNISYS